MPSSVQLVDGYYLVAFVCNQKIPYLTNNRSLDEERLKLIRRRLLSNNELFMKFKTTIGTYTNKGHAEQVPDSEIIVHAKPLWYLPHHPVFNPNKSVKLRVFF